MAFFVVLEDSLTSDRSSPLLRARGLASPAPSFVDDSDAIGEPRGSDSYYAASQEGARIDYEWELCKIQAITKKHFRHEQRLHWTVHSFEPQQRRMLASIRCQDYDALMNDAWAIEIATGLSETELHTLKINTLPVLLATCVSALEAVVTGDMTNAPLISESSGNLPVEANPWRIPIVYRLGLVDIDGKPPTSEDFKVVRKTLEKYRQRDLEHSLHEAIDTFKAPRLLDDSVYKYISKISNGVWEHAEERSNALAQFIEGTKIGPRLFCIGFTGEAEQRRLQHQQHAGSNFLLNLIEAVLAVHPEVKRKYVQSFQPILQVFEPTHGIAETVFSRLAGCAVSQGGCMHHPAGRSAQKLQEVTGQQWRDLEDIALRMTPLRENWALYREQLERAA